MQEKLLLLTSKQVARRLTEVFDFVWPTATAIWNLRWQVAGYVSASPAATESKLAGRFVAGSGTCGTPAIERGQRHRQQWPTSRPWVAV